MLPEFHGPHEELDDRASGPELMWNELHLAVDPNPELGHLPACTVLAPPDLDAIASRLGASSLPSSVTIRTAATRGMS